MKKTTLLLSAIFVLFAVSAASAQVRRQTEAPRRAVIKANVLSPFALTASGFVEYAFAPQLSAQLGAFTTGVSIKDVDFSGYGFTPEVRYYLSETKQAPNGVYVAGYGRILNYKLTVDDEDAGKTYEATYSPVGAGVAAGNQWIFNSGISVDLFLGLGVNGGSLKVKSGTEDDFDLGFLNLVGSGVRIRPGLTVGYSF
ncbi:DUF3575 domain-containing protein [Pontibacter korlensis]|uniref:DUF3575 domain-containing protein n=1 Tax=Pontibacter korlensis TaxID=400092 RepID=A0A0E3ZEE4_9BACT|nr:DUF3575 domain-containing protein [Pontibacter korlensis]AKD02849.1 hypothetical protein PKOR_06555 [Pontibacter korlensis]